MRDRPRADVAIPSCCCSTSRRPGLAPVIVQQVFELVQRIRAGGLTVLIVEQNVQQVLRVVDRAYLLEAGSIRAAGHAGRAAGERHHPARPTSASERADDARIFDIYLLEALINGILLGGVLALLALGLNLIFGVIDVVWICYAELIMLGMYGMYFLVQRLSPAALAGGAALHRCWSRVLGVAAALARDRAAAAAPRRSTSCWPPAACCSSCRASPP